ncbi:MAG: PqqD family protein [Pseudomonadota bacterium]
MAIALDSKIAKTDQCILAEADDDLVLLSLADGRFYALKETGRRAWELLDEHSTLSTLVSAMQLEFEIDNETCARELTDLLMSLKEREFITVVD